MNLLRIQHLLILTLALALSGGVVRALPVSAPGTAGLHIEINGATSVLQNYTIGIYDRSHMTAGVNDPDFQVQALQADHMMLLQEFGGPSAGSFDLNLSEQADIGIFLIRNATLRDFSLGQNPYKPIFSTEGAPGSSLFSLLSDSGNQTVYSLQLMGTSGTHGGVLPAGFSLADADPGLTISLTKYGDLQPLLLDDMNPRTVIGPDASTGDPTVPEPATLTMIGLGLAAAMRRRVARSLKRG